MKECIKSIKGQTYSNFEVWIIDGASSDGTYDYLKTLEPPFNWISEKDNGVYEAMNKGIELSKGEWLYFLGADDIFFDKDTLASIFKANIDSKFDLIIGSVRYNFSVQDSLFLKKNDGNVSSSWSKKMWIKNTLHHQGILYKKSLFEKQYYSIKYKILADYALNLNLYEKGIKAFTTEQIIAVCGTNGLSKGYHWKMYQEEISLKTNQSSIVLQPLFFVISSIKYLIKKQI